MCDRMAGMITNVVRRLNSQSSFRRTSIDGALAQIQHTFAGSNEEYEIETLREFDEKIEETLAIVGSRENIVFGGWIFQQVDFTPVPEEEFNEYNFAGASFWGCTLPAYSSKQKLIESGADFLDQVEGIPFKAIRAHMYRQEELLIVDAAMYQWYLAEIGIKAKIAQTIHDFFIQDALFDYVEGKTIIVVMGGHGLHRNSEEYKQVARLGLSLASKGFIVATGGGPGAMESANLGAYMLQRGGAEELEKALTLIGSVRDPSCSHEYEDLAPPRSVIAKYGYPTWDPSIGIPTYLYGHEPTNMFTNWSAKMFDNAVREGGLINIGNGGIIYTPGSAGTRQEVFQAACRNHYAPKGKEIPLVFMNKEFWEESGVFNCLEKCSRGTNMHRWLSMVDEVDEVTSILTRYREEYRLPKTSLDKLEKEHNKLYMPHEGRRQRRVSFTNGLEAFNSLRLSESSGEIHDTSSLPN